MPVEQANRHLNLHTLKGIVGGSPGFAAAGILVMKAGAKPTVVDLREYGRMSGTRALLFGARHAMGLIETRARKPAVVCMNDLDSCNFSVYPGRDEDPTSNHNLRLDVYKAIVRTGSYIERTSTRVVTDDSQWIVLASNAARAMLVGDGTAGVL